MSRNALEMLYRRSFRLEMSKSIDCIECCIKGLIEIEVGHIPLHKICLQLLLIKFLFAISQCGGIQIQSGGLKAPASHLANQTTRSATGLEESSHGKGNMFLEDICKESAFARSVFEET
jgi:hypothetical protein